MINLDIEGEQEVEVMNKQGKAIAVVSVKAVKETKGTKKDRKTQNMNTSLCEEEKENEDYYDNVSQENI